MADPIKTATTSSSLTTASRLVASHDPDGSAVRPRNRRLISIEEDSRDSASPSVPSSSTASTLHLPGALDLSSRGTSPRRRLNVAQAEPGYAKSGSGVLENPWASGWSAMQGLAASWLSRDGGPRRDIQNSGMPTSLQREHEQTARVSSGTWGPDPPADARLRAQDIAGGSLASREAALRAAKTASVLESHEGVNGGLDVSGRFKHRTSDDFSRQPPDEDGARQEQLVYIHHIQPSDTYAGIVLKYKCREDSIRRMNGLWSWGSLQTRRWLAVPVDDCGVRGRPCASPSGNPLRADLLAPTPEASYVAPQEPAYSQDDYFSGSPLSRSSPTAIDTERQPWTHVKWVDIESFPQPIEIGRMSKRALGFFPPRRRKSLQTGSTLSTPRQSLDLPSTTQSSADIDASIEALRGHSLLNNKPPLLGPPGSSTPVSSRTRGGSIGTDQRPLWMRRPGGVGSLGKSARTPGPERDYLNTWAKKHLPGLNIESLPSMSVMDSETASFGFGTSASGVAEGPFDQARDISLSSRQGTGIDRAAAAVETWLRGALARRPGTPISGHRGRYREDSDLIELTDTNSDDGRQWSSTASSHVNPSSLHLTTSGMSSKSDGGTKATPAKGKKDD